MAQVRIEGLDKVLKKVKSIEDLSVVKRGMKAAALHVKGKVAKYPPETAANRPNERGRWYERGYGPRWPGGGRRTSETLGRKWTIGERDGGLTQVIGNNVSYGPYVQDEEMQAWFHRERGWKTIQDVAQEESDEVVKFLAKMVDKELD